MPENTSGLAVPGSSDEIEILCLAARLVLESGGETYRVEETVRRMAAGLHMPNVNVVAFPTSIFVADGTHAQICRVSRRSTHMLRLVRANDVSRRVEHGDLTACDARRALEEIAAMPAPPRWLLNCMYGLTAGSFSLLFGGGLGTFLIGFALGVIVQLIAPLFSHLEMGTLFFNFAGGFISAVGAHALYPLWAYGDINAVIVGGIMPLLTGLSMTTAMRDTMYGDLVSGIARAIEALLLAGSCLLYTSRCV